MFDTLIRGGAVVDGTGRPAFAADVAVSGGRIAAIGDLSAASAAHVIDAAGRTVTPGFIDIHRHADAALFRPGFRMVIFSVLLMVCVLFWRHGIMGTREFSWQKAINFVKNPLGFIKRKGAAQ